MDNKYVIDLEKRVEHIESKLENLSQYQIVKEIIYEGSEMGARELMFNFRVIIFGEDHLVYNIAKSKIYEDKNYSPAEVVYSYFNNIENLVMFHITYLELELMLKQLRGK